MRDQTLLFVFHILLCLGISNKFPVAFPVTHMHRIHGERSKDGYYNLDPCNTNNSSVQISPHYGSYVRHSKFFNILSFGAIGNGTSDDTKALKAAWKAACMVSKATIVIPSDFKFLIGLVTLQGPCKPQLTIRIDGTILAPTSVTRTNNFQWLNVKWIKNFSIQGSGTLDGQGSMAWNTSHGHYNQKGSNHALAVMRPTVIRFYKGYNITVSGIQIINSPQCHLKFDNSVGINVKNITISSPKDSPNTDGIHLQNSRNVEIKHSTIGCGDDCVSIQSGCSNVHIHHISCSPGHGISVGGLGKGKSLACVSNVSVENVMVENALSGVRIKTWQGGLGSVRNVTFSNVRVSEVETPIMIDQYYCNKKLCRNNTDAVAISDVAYKGITGTYLLRPMYLACSDSAPCTDIDLKDIQLSPVNESQISQGAFCWKSYGKSQGFLEPTAIGCLRTGSRMLKALTMSHNNATCA